MKFIIIVLNVTNGIFTHHDSSSIWVQLKSHLRRIEPLRMTGSDMTGNDVSHVPCPEVCSAHAQPEIASHPP